MSVYFSKCQLNTYCNTAYFEAHIPDDYPTSLILQASRAFRRLPPRLKELAVKAKAWVLRGGPECCDNNKDWYDDEGYELDPDTGKRLTDEEIDEQWHEDDDEFKFKVTDIPKPPGGFADPATWEFPKPEEKVDLVDRGGLTEDGILNDIASRGMEATAEEYGISSSQMFGIKNGKALAKVILDMHGKPWPIYSNCRGSGNGPQHSSNRILPARFLSFYRPFVFRRNDFTFMLTDVNLSVK